MWTTRDSKVGRLRIHSHWNYGKTKKKSPGPQPIDPFSIRLANSTLLFSCLVRAPFFWGPGRKMAGWPFTTVLLTALEWSFDKWTENMFLGCFFCLWRRADSIYRNTKLDSFDFFLLLLTRFQFFFLKFRKWKKNRNTISDMNRVTSNTKIFADFYSVVVASSRIDLWLNLLQLRG